MDNIVLEGYMEQWLDKMFDSYEICSIEEVKNDEYLVKTRESIGGETFEGVYTVTHYFENEEEKVKICGGGMVLEIYNLGHRA